MTMKAAQEIGYSFLIGLILTLFSYVVADYFNWVKASDINLLEAFAVLTSYMCTWLCVRQSRWNYFFGVITTAAYSTLYFQYWDLPSLGWFNLYLVGSLLFGYWRWGPDGNPRPVTRVKNIWWLGYAGLAAGIFVLLYTINTIFGYETTWIDAGLAVASGVAQFLLDNKKLETWAVWVAVNIVSIPFYISQEIYIVAFQYVFFLLNAGYGFYMWNRSQWNDHENELTDGVKSVYTFPNKPVTLPDAPLVFDDSEFLKEKK